LFDCKIVVILISLRVMQDCTTTS